MCDAGKDFGDYMTNFEYIKAPVCAYADTTGFFTLAAFVYGAVLASIYIRTDSLVIPTVLIVIVGGAVVPQLPGPAIPFAVLLLLIVPSGVVALAYYSYSR